MATRVAVAAFRIPGHSFVKRDDNGVIVKPKVDHMPEQVHFGDEHYDVNDGLVIVPLEIGLNAGWEQAGEEELKKLEDVLSKKAAKAAKAAAESK